MTTYRRSGGWVIIISFILAFILTILPLPSWLAILRPEWVTLFLIYWCMAIPHRVGVGSGFCIGLLLDILLGGLLGQHALVLSITAYLILKLHQRLRVFPPWQQALSILVLVIFGQVLIIWIKGISGQPPDSWTYWLPAVSTMVIWPVIFTLLRGVRRTFRVN